MYYVLSANDGSYTSWGDLTRNNRSYESIESLHSHELPIARLAPTPLPPYRGGGSIERFDPSVFRVALRAERACQIQEWGRPDMQKESPTAE